MLVVALTGGIGSGKTTVARHLATLGVPIIDADLIARELVQPGSECLAEIVETFGPAVLDSDGSLDRSALRQRVFADPSSRARLEAILHPRIREVMTRRLKALDAPYAVLVIPLLIETGQKELAHRVLVVDAPEAAQIARVRERDGMDGQQVRAILAAQSDRATRLLAADDVIENDGDLDALLRRTEALHRRYLELSEGPTRRS